MKQSQFITTLKSQPSKKNKPWNQFTSVLLTQDTPKKRRDREHKKQLRKQLKQAITSSKQPSKFNSTIFSPISSSSYSPRSSSSSSSDSPISDNNTKSNDHIETSVPSLSRNLAFRGVNSPSNTPTISVQSSSPIQQNNNSNVSSPQQISSSNVSTPLSISSYEGKSIEYDNSVDNQRSFNYEDDYPSKSTQISIPDLKKEATMCNATMVLKFGLGKEPDVRRRLEMGCFMRLWAGSSNGCIPVDNWILIATDYYNIYDCEKAREMISHAFMLTLSEIQEWSRKHKKVQWNASEKSTSHSSRWLSAMLIATKQIVHDLPYAAQRILECVLCEAKIYSRLGEDKTARNLFDNLLCTVNDIFQLIRQNGGNFFEFENELIALLGSIKHQYALHYIRIRDNYMAETMALQSRAAYLNLETRYQSPVKDLGIVLNTLAYSMLCQGKTHPAREFVAESIHRRETQHLLPVSGYHQLALLYKTQQNWDFAEALLRHCIELRLQNFAGKVVDIAQTYLNLAELYIDKDGPLEKAKELFEESYNYFKKIGDNIPSEHKDVYERVEFAIQLRKKQNTPIICEETQYPTFDNNNNNSKQVQSFATQEKDRIMPLPACSPQLNLSNDTRNNFINELIDNSDSNSTSSQNTPFDEKSKPCSNYTEQNENCSTVSQHMDPTFNNDTTVFNNNDILSVDFDDLPSPESFQNLDNSISPMPVFDLQSFS